MPQKPWEKYAQQDGPWKKYAQAEAPPPKSDPTSAIKAAPSFGSPAYLKEKMYNAADTVTNALPAIGGIAGGLLGSGLGSIPGAVIGGAGGEAARQLSRRALGFEAPQTSSDAAEQIGGEGLRQGAYEVGGQVMRGVGRAVAPKVAEAAVAPGKRLLKSIPEDVNIGRTILDETKGTKLGGIAGQLKTKIGDASTEVDRLANNAKQAGATVPLTPARQLVDGEVGTASAKNSPSYLRDVSKVQDQLTHQYGPNGKPLTIALPNGQQANAVLPSAVDPVRARALKQGIDLEIGNWNPESQAAIAPLQERVRGIINSGFHTAVPDAAPLDAKMTSMIPAREAAWNTSFNPGLTKSLFERFARPTGALVGAGIGAGGGYKEGGVGGAVAGGVAGLALPLAISSPQSIMRVARIADSPIGPRAIRIASPLLESQRKRKLETEDASQQ